MFSKMNSSAACAGLVITTAVAADVSQRVFNMISTGREAEWSAEATNDPTLVNEFLNDDAGLSFVYQDEVFVAEANVRNSTYDDDSDDHKLLLEALQLALCDLREHVHERMAAQDENFLVRFHEHHAWLIEIEDRVKIVETKVTKLEKQAEATEASLDQQDKLNEQQGKFNAVLNTKVTDLEVQLSVLKKEEEKKKKEKREITEKFVENKKQMEKKEKDLKDYERLVALQKIDIEALKLARIELLEMAVEYPLLQKEYEIPKVPYESKYAYM